MDIYPVPLDGDDNDGEGNHFQPGIQGEDPEQGLLRRESGR
mgnify:CR=1 FL=1